jgi:ketosteroid isomerase-like protein
MTNVELIQQMYADFSTGNMGGVLGLFHPDIEWNECVGMPFVKDSGQYKGHDAIVGNVFMQLGVHIDGFNVEVTDIFGGGDKVAMQGFYNGTNKATGNPFHVNATHIWTLKDGKVTHFFQAVDTASLLR